MFVNEMSNISIWYANKGNIKYYDFLIVSYKGCELFLIYEKEEKIPRTNTSLPEKEMISEAIIYDLS